MTDAQQPSVALPKVVILIVHFGDAPPWMPFFLRSCAANPAFDWILFSDFDISDAPPNVCHHKMSLDAFVSKVEAELDLELSVIRKDPYKLNDVKPMLAHVFADQVEPYDYWGWGDLDVVYGDLAEHFAPQLGLYDVISCHTYLLSGHFALFRNTHRVRTLFSCFPNWSEILALPTNQAFDENIMTTLFFADQPDRRMFYFAPMFRPSVMVDDAELTGHFSERFSTFNRPRLLPDGTVGVVKEWYWRDGKLTSDAIGDRSLAYAHFSNWNSGRYSRAQKRKPWSKGGMQIDPSLSKPLNAFRINSDGFFAIKDGNE